MNSKNKEDVTAEIAIIVHRYYLGKSLSLKEVEDRILAVSNYIVGHWEIRDCIDLIVNKSNYSNPSSYSRACSRIRYQIKTIVSQTLERYPSLRNMRSAYA